jgi:nucleoid-associated protein YgaU
LSEPTRSGTPEKAEIHVFNDPKNTSGQASKVISCMFRPNQLSFTKTASWSTPMPDESGGKKDKKKSTATQKGQNVPTVEFGGGQAATVTLDLLFDTTSTGADVRSYTDEIINLTIMQTGSEVKPPPLCRFVWGKIRSFLAYVSSVTVTFKMFLPDGTPVRADVKASLSQYKDDDVFKKQNPTSFSEPRKMWIVTEGERLEWIAYQEYGHPKHWRHIARSNGILNPLDLQPGQVLKLTPLPERKN